MFGRKNTNKEKFEAKAIIKELYKDVDDGKKEFNINRLNMKNHINKIKDIPKDTVFGKEFHANFKTNTGSKVAQFCGPGTNISTRVLRGDRGLGGKGHTDKMCLLHDLDYRRASTLSTSKFDKIRITGKSDDNLIKNIKEDKTDFYSNKIKIILAMRLKKTSEGLNFISQDKYVGDDTNKKILNDFDYSDNLFNEINKIDDGDFMKSLMKLPKKDFEDFFIELHEKKLTIKTVNEIM